MIKRSYLELKGSMREPHRQKLILKGLGVAQNKLNKRKYKCILPSCTKNAIKSHSQQKKHQLSAIAENLMVYSIEKNIYKSFKTKSEKRELLQKKSIGESSTYPGYCNTHDTNIFAPIENGNLDVNLPEHNFLLLLRSVSYEFANKRSVYDRSKDILKENYELLTYEGRRHFEIGIDGIKQYLEIDAPVYLANLFEAYDTKNYSIISYNSFTIPKNVGVSSTTMFSPLRENHYEFMAINAKSVQPTVSFNLVPDSQKTQVSFIWFSEHNSLCEEVAKISSSNKDILKTINMYAFTESEDTCIRPSIWEGLTEIEKKQIYKHFAQKDSIAGASDIPQIIKI